MAAAREDVESLQYTRNAESKTPLLDQYSTDLTELAKEGRIDRLSAVSRRLIV